MNTQNDTTSEEMGKRKQGRRSNGHGGLILRGNVFYARFTNALGKRVEVSTHCSNRAEAEKVLATYTEPLRKSQSDDEIKLRLTQQLEVMELRKDIKNMERIALDDIAERFLNHRELMDTTSGTRNNYARQIRILVKEIKAKYKEVRYMDEVSGVVVDGIICELSKHYTSASFNLALATYKRCWELLSRSNPFKKIGKRRIDKSRHRIQIDDDDVRNIFKACRDDVERAIWACGIYLGLRCGDICNLTYGALSHDLKTITCLPMKTKKHMASPLIIPICAPLRNMLLPVLELKKIGNAQYNDEPLWDIWKRRYKNSDAHALFGVTLKKAGLSVSHKDENGHLVMDTGFHVTRHYFVSTAARIMSPLLVQKIVGHSAISMTEHYFAENQVAMAEGLNQMPDFSNGCSSKVDDTSEILKLLNEVKNEDESALDCLKRLLEKSIRMAS